MAMISPGTVLTEPYTCAYVGNLCTRLDLVILLNWLASVFFQKLKAVLSFAAPFLAASLVLSRYHIPALVVLLPVILVLGIITGSATLI